MIDYPRQGMASGKAVVALVIFVGMIGLLAWVRQFLPGAGKTSGPTASTHVEGVNTLVQFDPESTWWDERAGAWKSLWDANDRDYLKEYEREKEGHFDYHFTNLLTEPIEVGLEATSCDCARVEAAVFSPEDWSLKKQLASDQWEWKTLVKSNDQGVVVPASGHGAVRILWKGRKQQGERLNLNTTVWTRPAAAKAPKPSLVLSTPIVMAMPLNFQPSQVQLGVLGNKAQVQFLAWSATRPEADLKISPEPDPLLDVQVEPLGEKEREQLQRDQNTPTRIVKAFRIQATLYENNQGKFLEQGHFFRKIPLVLDGEPYEGPTLLGTVRSDVDIGAPEDLGKIQLRTFSADDDLKRVISLRSEPATELSIENFDPPFLETRIKIDPENSTPSRKHWRLELTIPANSLLGELDGSITLQTQGNQTRKIRIPVLGTAVPR